MERVNNKLPGPVPIQVNIDELPYLTCPNMVNPIMAPEIPASVCGNNTFDRVEVIKVMSPIVSPTGKAHNITLPLYRCTKCGYLLERNHPRPTPVVAQMAR